MAHNTRIGPGDLGLQAARDTGPDLGAMTLDEIERWAIRRALARTDGDISKTAQHLGISRAALYRRLEKYQMQ